MKRKSEVEGKKKKIKYIKEYELSYITQEDKEFEEIKQNKYKGLAFVPQKNFKISQEKIFQEFEKMVENKIIRNYHIIINDQLVIPTIQRALLGVKGMTYKYFNIRLFTIPWENTIFEKLNTEMSSNSLNLNQNIFKYEKGSDFNISLLNYYDTKKVHLKYDDFHGIDVGMSVKWHRDTFLETNSTVGVYQCTEDINDSSWKLGFRIAWDIETPALLMNVKSDEAYFMLYNFNETHQHAIFTGDTNRYTSTHRKIPEEGNSFEYISKKCENLINKFRNIEIKNSNDVQDLFNISNEVEFDWIKQFWLQGYEYSQVHQYWIPLMKVLEDYWNQIQDIIEKLSENVSNNEQFNDELEKQQEMKEKWNYWTSLMFSKGFSNELLPIENPKRISIKKNGTK
eukprot:gene6966-11132_t